MMIIVLIQVAFMLVVAVTFLLGRAFGFKFIALFIVVFVLVVVLLFWMASMRTGASPGMGEAMFGFYIWLPFGGVGLAAGLLGWASRLVMPRRNGTQSAV